MPAFRFVLRFTGKSLNFRNPVFISCFQTRGKFIYFSLISLHSQVMNSPVCLSETEHVPVLIQGRG